MKIIPWLFVLFVLALNGGFEGIAVMYLWRWYVVPVFGLPALSIVQALGISIIVGCVTHQTNTQPSKVEPKAVLVAVFNPLAYLACGWLLRFLL